MRQQDYGALTAGTATTRVHADDSSHRERQRARHVIASHATDADELAELLDLLDLRPAEGEPR